MTIFLSLAVLLLISIAVVLLVLLTQPQRGRQLLQVAAQLNLHYHQHASLNAAIRAAHFQLIVIGQLRDIRHFMEGYLHDNWVNVFDYSVVTHTGIHTQTLVLLSCALPFKGRFYLSQKPWLNSDNFTDNHQPKLQPLSHAQKPQALAHWHLSSDQPLKLRQLLGEKLCAWLLEHEQLQVEWSNGILLIYRPQYLLSAEQIVPAIEHGQQLRLRLREALG